MMLLSRSLRSVLSRTTITSSPSMCLSRVNIRPSVGVSSTHSGTDQWVHFQELTQQRREYGSNKRKDITNTNLSNGTEGVRITTLLCKHLGLSRRQSERMVLLGRVTLFGKVVDSPSFEFSASTDEGEIAIKVDGRLIYGAEKTTRVWLANKLKGELITEDDPDGRPSMLQRLKANGTKHLPTHLKPVGRLDMMTEGLMIFSNDGQYARNLELPSNHLWRTYRVRVHGRLTLGKLTAMRKGVTVRGASGEVVQSTGKDVNGSTNTWLQITCTEGKNRQLRRILGSMGLDVTRLIRISYGDYDLNSIPPGLAIEVPVKPLESMKKKGSVGKIEETTRDKGGTRFDRRQKRNDGEEGVRSTVEWVNYA
ncbi:predicted protein [Thalassiosira pseudonana CCMP1335]|uniref:Pseudouridine synthase RsuA/RluA-like domain-containing protein n=1 Tax=Thalassiosira pseudonana TaxID=35128 RepID=B5YMC9_THAPS|nr:predicted protein [Thalassiosira pseudonana CCMP1335]ACI64787.1 predicted protein [Thalassiosira pseudonana CCMP1335]